MTVNYKGEDTYKTFFGFICTMMLAAVMLAYALQTGSRLLNREEPERAFYKMTNSRSKDESLNLPELGS